MPITVVVGFQPRIMFQNRRFVHLGLIYILTPFPNIPAHVIQSILICWKTSDRGGVRIVVHLKVGKIVARSIGWWPLVSPWILAGSHCNTPLGVCGQSIFPVFGNFAFLLFFIRQPRAKRLGIQPTHPYHGISICLLEPWVSPLRME